MDRVKKNNSHLKISTEIYSAKRIVGEERAIEYIAGAGFDAWDFSMFEMVDYNYQKKYFFETDHPLSGRNYLAFARRLKQIGLDNGIVCNQTHAPSPTPEMYWKRAIECTAEAGGEICVIHVEGNGTPEENAERYLEILPFAKSCGVKIATENLYCWDEEKQKASPGACGTPENFLAHLRAANDPYLVGCLDIGHAEMRGVGTSAVEMIKALGPALRLLHLHDNDLQHDSHQLPFTMQIDFNPIMKALKEIGYDGYFTLEADNHLRAYTEETLAEGLRTAAAAARRLARMYEEA